MTTLINPSLRDHLDGIVACLRLAGGIDWTVGNGIAPDGKTPPYIVVHVLPGGGHGGPVNNPNADVGISFQLTCVAADPSEAAWLNDQAVAALTTTPIVVAGRKACGGINGVTHDGGPGGIARDDTSKPSLFYCTPRFTLSTTPA